MGLAIGRDLSLRARRHAPAIVALCALTYFGFHLIAGERGLRAWVHVGDDLAVARAELALSQAEQDALERRVRLMRPDSLDPDMLDEQARTVLGYTRSDEVVILDTGTVEE